MDKTILKLKILGRAETTLLQLGIRRWAWKLAFCSLALSFIIIFLAMLNVSAYTALEPSQGGPLAAIWVALVNLIFAVLLILVAVSLKPRADEKVVREIRELALAELADDVDEAKESIAQVQDDVTAVKDMFGKAKGMFSGGGFDLEGVGSIIGYLIKLLKKKKES